MRNGNFLHKGVFSDWDSGVLILPMRNGNYECRIILYYHKKNHRSYPTYEEWKPSPSFFAFSIA